MAASEQGASHTEIAEGRLSRAVELAEGTAGSDGYIPIALAEAQVQATLAVADQLERLNETLAASNLTYADGMLRNG
jgi:hypothetical protein